MAPRDPSRSGSSVDDAPTRPVEDDAPAPEVVERRGGAPATQQAAHPPPEEAVYPVRLLRLAAMSFALLEELQRTPLDRRARRRMLDI
jgi:hypothetical protein